MIQPGRDSRGIAVGWWLDRPGAAGMNRRPSLSLAGGWLPLLDLPSMNFFDYLLETGGRIIL